MNLFDSTGKSHLTKARISGIRDHQVELTYQENESKSVTFADSTISFIGFTSTGRVMITGTVNTLLVGAGITGGAIIVCGVVIQVSIILLSPILVFIDPDLNRGSDFNLLRFGWVGVAFKGVGQLFRVVLPFRKKIRLNNGQWQMRTKVSG